MKTKILVSACLLGSNCKYNGKSNKNENVIALSEKFELIPVCPECFGGLPTPRMPAEIRDGRVVTKSGDDVTAQFQDGANQTLYIAKESNCPAALLKEKARPAVTAGCMTEVFQKPCAAETALQPICFCKTKLQFSAKVKSVS